MEKDKIIIGVLIVVILALLVGISVTMPDSTKTDSKLEIIGNDTITEGETLQIKLTDTNGTALSNQTVKITFTDKDNSTSDYSVVTNDEGVGELKLDKNAGNYTVTISYNGNDSYNCCNATKKITIEKKVIEAEVISSSSEPSEWYDSKGEHHYYENGVEYVGTRDGQHMDIDTWNYVKIHGMGD